MNRLILTERQVARLLAPHLVLDAGWAGGGYVRLADSNVSFADVAASILRNAQAARFPEDDFFLGISKLPGVEV